MKKALIAIASLVMTVSASQAQVLVAGWDFQTTSNGGTAVVTAPATGTTANNISKVYVANFGAGSLYMDGSNFSSNWFLPALGSTNAELSTAGGASVNTTGTLLSSVVTSPSALSFLPGQQSGTTPNVVYNANGKSAVFRFSMSGYSNLSISLAAQRTATGFTSQLWEYSANGGTSWSSIGSLLSGSTAGTLTASFTTSDVLSLPTFSGLDGSADALVRVTFTGGTSASGNNRVDNIQFTAVPEPSSGALLVLGGAALVAVRSLRKKNS